MSKRKDRERAEAGQPFRNEPAPKTNKKWVCANCHEPGLLLKSGSFYYHENCLKEVIPFEEG